MLVYGIKIPENGAPCLNVSQYGLQYIRFHYANSSHWRNVYRS